VPERALEWTMKHSFEQGLQYSARHWRLKAQE